MTDLVPQQASEGLWSFLNMNTAGTTLREAFLNAPKLNGFEAWRAITEPIRSQSVALRISLRKVACAPTAAKSIHDYGRTLVAWKTSYRKYREAKGEAISDEQRRELSTGILPAELSQAMLVETHKHGRGLEWSEDIY